MTAAWRSPPGETRTCPHCEAKILSSAPICPACHRHLYFDAVRTDRPVAPTFCPLHVEGTPGKWRMIGEPPGSQVFPAVFFCLHSQSILVLVGSERVGLDPGGQSRGQSGTGY
jgi:hypothetical protein